MQALAGLKERAPIPAMTTDAERELYYRLVRESAGRGAIVELGAWLGASTAYIAAGIRDSGFATKAHVYDKFQSKPGHAAKVKAFYDKRGLEGAPLGPCFDEFRANLGDLFEYVDPHPGQIENLKWKGGPIAVLITDAPKRVPAISAVLTEFRDALQPGAIMAWQDFCHFPSYEIPACLYRLKDRIEFVEAVVPGTTLAFRVKEQWNRAEVSRENLALGRWRPAGIAEAWHYWLNFVPKEKASLFGCGAAMFLCDIGKPLDGVDVLAKIYEMDAGAILPKWRYLYDARPDFLSRYRPLFAYLDGKGALC
jgi:hypothetical protein